MNISKKDIDNIKWLIEMEEFTLAIYRLGRIVVGNLVPDRLNEFPEFKYSYEQEQELLLFLAELQGNPKTKVEYQEI